MTASRKKRITDKEARKMKPKSLPPVEPELAVPCPRPMVWVARSWSHGSISPHDAELLQNGVAARAWVTSVEVEHDREGPDIFANFVFQDGEGDGALHHGTFFGSYDAMHLAIGFPDFAGWLGRAICEGGTLTVLYPAGRPEEHRIYGTMELYLERDLCTAIEAYQQAGDGEAEERLAQVRALMFGPLGPLQGDYDAWKRYYGLVTRMGRSTPTGRTPLPEIVGEAVLALAEGRHDPRPVKKLSKMCREYMPGIWAAA